MQADPPQRSRRRGSIQLLVALVLSLGAIGVGPGAARSDTGPTPLQVDVSTLVPATVELSTPVVCGALTVYDQEDLSTLCSPTTLAATPILAPTCPLVVSGSVRLQSDITCWNSDGIVVGSDNTVIDLNGHTIRCYGAGYMHSCQGTGTSGIRTNGHDNVHIFSHVQGGTIDGFAQDVLVQPSGTGDPSNNVKVKQLLLTGPPGDAGRPFDALGVEVFETNCSTSSIRIGGGTHTGNVITNTNVGVYVNHSQCVYVGDNSIHDNTGSADGSGSGGIRLDESSDNHVRGNVADRNGLNGVDDAGLLLLQSSVNLVVDNQFDKNLGHGIFLFDRSGGNEIDNNEMLGNGSPPTHHDASDDGTGVPANTWNYNNRCQTQSAPQPPPGVCGLGEG